MRSGNNITDSLIRLVLSLSWNRGGKSYIEDLLSGFSGWQDLFRRCIREKVCGSFYRQCKNNSLTGFLPDKYKTSFEKEYSSITGHNIMQTENLENVLRLFEENSAELLVIKGYSLLKNIYPSPGERYPADIDLVVEKKSLGRTKQLLLSYGYKSSSLYPNVLVKAGYLPIDLKTDLTGTERIHTRALASFLDREHIFKRAIPWDPGKNHVKIPTWEDHILILCSHAEKHSYSKLYFFYDIASILYAKQNTIDFAALKDKAFEAGLQRPFYICFRYIRERFFFPVEVTLLEDIRKKISFSRLEQKLLKKILSGKKLPLSGALLPVFSIRDSRKRLSFLWEIVFPDKEIMRQCTGISNPKLSWLMYPVRLFQLAGMFFKSLLGAIR